MHKTAVLAAFSMAAAGCTRNSSITVLEVTANDLPYSAELNLKKGDAYRLRLPDGKELAFWCTSQDSPAAEQTSQSGLDMSWGEQPFKRSPVVYERDSEQKKATTYILFEGVTTYTGSGRSESSFVIGNWRIVLAENISSPEGLPITVTVRQSASSYKPMQGTPNGAPDG